MQAVGNIFSVSVFILCIEWAVSTVKCRGAHEGKRGEEAYIDHFKRMQKIQGRERTGVIVF